jgi:FkbM family methyltransferase
MRLHFQRLSLAWHGFREKRGRAVALRQDGDLLRVDDGVRSLFIPHARLAAAYRQGVNAWIDAVAAKYVGGTGYAPREGDIILDIGAGIGEFALWCAEAGAQVVAFEPDPLAYACLERNIAPLGNVQIVSCALWKERADLRLHGSMDTTASSLIEDGKSNSRYADVEAWPLDQLDFLIKVPVIDLMKVDGEGVEPEILIGATRTLRRTRILAVDVGAVDKRPRLRGRVEAILDSLNFRSVPHDRDDTIFALNTAMVGPFNSRVRDRPDS